MNALFHMARADFLERSRRYSFLITLVATLFLAYQVHVGGVVVRLDPYRGVLNSAWVGSVMTLTITGLLSLIGFYLVKNAVERDRKTGVGEILATTPMSRPLYVIGKTLSNFAVLATLVVILAASAIVLQLLGHESRQLDLVALLSPFVLVALPAMLLVAAVAVFFECVPGLRGGFGNVVYFFLWPMPVLIAEKAPQLPDLYGIRDIGDSMRAAAHAAFADYKGSFSLTIATQHEPLAGTFVWNGVHWTAQDVMAQLGVVGVALGLALVGALFFDRFDPSRARRKAKAEPEESATTPTAKIVRITPAHAVIPRLAHAEAGFHFGALVVAELRLLYRQTSPWWRLAALAMIAAGFVAPPSAGRQIILPIAWLWPVLLWSGMGSRERRFGTEGLVFASPHLLTRQWPAVWLAGIILSAVMTCGVATRVALDGDSGALAAWAIGALFVPAMALALGVWTGSGKFFEVAYTTLWYLGPINHVPQLDYTGATASPERAAITAGFVVATAALLALSFVGRKNQLASA